MNSGEGYCHQCILLQIGSLIKQPFSAGILLVVVIILLLIICSALISAAEVAFFSLSSKDLSQLKNNPSKADKILIGLVEKPRELLATILISNNFVNVSVVILFYYITLIIFDFSHFPVLGFILQVLAVTGFIVLFGEVIPKVYSAQNNLKVARLMTYPLFVLEKIFYPISYVLIASTNVIEKKLLRKNNHTASLEEINHAIDMTVDEKTSKQEINILKGIVKFGNTTVKEIMKARTDVIAVEHNTNFQNLMKVVKDSGYSRIPVFKDTLDHVEGVLYSKDLIAHTDTDKDFNWQQLLRPPFFVPETKKIDMLLKDFQSKKTHLAVVVDEYGGTAGIVTLEDIMEEVIGEIKDEFDELHEIKYTQEGGSFIFEGKTMLNDLCKVMNLKQNAFDKIRGDADSLAGLVLELSGKMPKVNEEIKYQKYIFTVLSADSKRILKVKVTILPLEIRDKILPKSR